MFFGKAIEACAATLALVSVAGRARASTFYDPIFDRMAITDRSTEADIQPRVWLLTAGGGTASTKALFTKIPDLNEHTWLYTGFQNIDSGIDAVWWWDVNNARQRVFFTTAGQILMMPFDNDQQAAAVTFAGGSYVVSGTVLAAVTFIGADLRRRMAVAAGTTINGTAGYVCIWESGDLGTSWTRSCSTDRPMPVTNPSNHDIVGVNLTNTDTVQFYFRNASGGLSRIRRTGTNIYAAHEDFNGTLIQPSIAAIESQVSGNIELAVIGTNNTVYTSRILPTATPSWSARVALPSGATPSNAPSALSVVKYHGTDFNGANPYTRTTLYVMGTNAGLYLISTTNDSGAWATSWTGPHYSPSGYLGSLGAVTTTTGDIFRLPRLFVTAGYPSYTLQEYYNNFGLSYTFRDHIRYQLNPVGVGDSTLSVAETSGAADNSQGIMTGMDRSYPNPWKQRVRSSTNGGTSFDSTDSVISPIYGVPRYISDGTVGIGGGLLHHTDVEATFTTACDTTDTEATNVVVYRRGSSASVLASLGSQHTFLIDTFSGSHVGGGLDHPWQVVTSDFSGTTAHVVYWGFDAGNTSCKTGMCYWKLARGGPCTSNANCPGGTCYNGICDTILGPLLITPLPSKPARAAVGANNEIYAYADHHRDNWTKICTLKNAFSTGGALQPSDCTTLGGPPQTCSWPTCSQPTAPLLSDGPFVPIGAPITNAPSGSRCPLDQSGNKFKCFDLEAITAIAADPITPKKLYAAYVAARGTTPNDLVSAIFFTKSTGGSSYGAWDTPIALTPTNGIYYDPAITVDTDGTVIVTYNQITPATVDQSGSATGYMKVSIDNGQTWGSPAVWSTWNTSSIQYHCSRGLYFMGDFRDPTLFGTRAFVPYQEGGSTTSPYLFRGRWMSRWTMVN